MVSRIGDVEVVGISLTSIEAKPRACVGLISRRRLVCLGFLAIDTGVMALIHSGPEQGGGPGCLWRRTELRPALTFYGFCC
jgi:hypothetical protein